ncbi:MAG: hypothetical protein GC159_20825 [Phycisphaera sp.]|nr:hypothetical protein [Phycisphaera sp.]
MARVTAAVLIVAMCAGVLRAGDLPTDEAGAIAYLKAKEVEISLDKDGHAVRVMSRGKPELTVDEYQLIGLLTHVEQMGLNAAPLTETQWGFLKKLPNLKRLSIWHGHGFATLEHFSGLPVESLTIGGCMGLRDKNRDDVAKQRDAILSLHDLPNLTYGNWYHSPLEPDDTHLAHIASQFPKLETLRLDFSAPRGTETTITPAGLAVLQKLPLTTLSLENASTFTAEHFKAIAGIKTLKGLLIDARRKSVSAEAVAAFRGARPDVAVAVANEGAEGPPQLPRKSNGQ